MSLQIRRLSYTLGAEITGIDLRKPLDEKSFNEVHTAFLEHCVLLFREQPLTQEQHIAFSRRFGDLDNNDRNIRDRDPKYPEILLNTNKPKPGGRSGFGYGATLWHSDKTRGPSCSLAAATLLRGIELPEVGGDTMFSNLYHAYEMLSGGMKKLIEGLHGIYIESSQLVVDASSSVAETKRLDLPIAMPLVGVHPETGRKALCLGEKVNQFVGMTVEESKPLIQFLFKHTVRPQFVYRHQWCKDDLLMWDSRCTNHIALGDFDGIQIRHMERTTVRGTPSGYVYDGPLQ